MYKFADLQLKYLPDIYNKDYILILTTLYEDYKLFEFLY